MSPIKSTQVIYDARGNIQYKSDVGRYWYDAARPNRMTNVTLESHPQATVTLSATRALSYVFDDYRANAQSINSVSVGNGNLEYTATLDTPNNRHTVRYESYTSFNMPSEFRYGNLTGPSCPAGYTLAPSTLGEICVKANAVTFAATVTYSCAPGQTLSGSTCTLTTTTAATASPYCPAGYAMGSFAGASPRCVYTSNFSYGYCPATPSGLTFVGLQENYGGGGDFWVSTSCGYTTHTSYSCPAGQTASGSTCIQSGGSVPATVTYSCPVDHTVSGSTGSGDSSPRWAASPAAVTDGVPIFRLYIAFDE